MVWDAHISDGARTWTETYDIPTDAEDEAREHLEELVRRFNMGADIRQQPKRTLLGVTPGNQPGDGRKQ